MILRPYQKTMVDRAKKALVEHGNTLCIGPTGSGKTTTFSSLIGKFNGAKTLVLQHRDELVDQNCRTFRKINPSIPVSLYTAGNKSWNGKTVFSMVQTLSRPKNLNTLPPFDLLVIDEAHHARAATYESIINKVKERNNNCMIAGFTATPTRGDKKGLRKIFNNVADHITIKDMIDRGFLVPPRAYVVDIAGVEEGLSKVRKLASDYDMAEVEAVMNIRVINEEVVRHWKEKAGDRKTIVFCSTIQHAIDVLSAFRESGVSAEMVTGETPASERAATLRKLEQGHIQVIVNVFCLTEGFDCPTISCVVLLRPCSFKSTLVQMAGRGLRTVDPERYPGVIKKDCIILDFGNSLKTHGNIDASADIDEPQKGDAPTKECPECNSIIPLAITECPICGFVFINDEEGSGGGEEDLTVDNVSLTEIDLINNSPFRWVDLFGTEKILVASGFEAWAGVFSPDGDNWYALGKERSKPILRKLMIGDRIRAISAADDFLREYESDNAAHKSKSWLRLPPTEKQLAALARVGYEVGNGFGFEFSRYSANCHLNFQWSRSTIERALNVH